MGSAGIFPPRPVGWWQERGRERCSALNSPSQDTSRATPTFSVPVDRHILIPKAMFQDNGMGQVRRKLSRQRFEDKGKKYFCPECIKLGPNDAVVVR